MTIADAVGEAEVAPDYELRLELESLLNRHSLENGSNTPDYILSDYLLNCLSAFDLAVNARHKWFGHPEPFVVE